MLKRPRRVASPLLAIALLAFIPTTHSGLPKCDAQGERDADCHAHAGCVAVVSLLTSCESAGRFLEPLNRNPDVQSLTDGQVADAIVAYTGSADSVSACLWAFDAKRCRRYLEEKPGPVVQSAQGAEPAWKRLKKRENSAEDTRTLQKMATTPASSGADAYAGTSSGISAEAVGKSGAQWKTEQAEANARAAKYLAIAEDALEKKRKIEIAEAEEIRIFQAEEAARQEEARRQAAIRAQRGATSRQSEVIISHGVLTPQENITRNAPNVPEMPDESTPVQGRAPVATRTGGPGGFVSAPTSRPTVPVSSDQVPSGRGSSQTADGNRSTAGTSKITLKGRYTDAIQHCFASSCFKAGELQKEADYYIKSANSNCKSGYNDLCEYWKEKIQLIQSCSNACSGAKCRKSNDRGECLSAEY